MSGWYNPKYDGGATRRAAASTLRAIASAPDCAPERAKELRAHARLIEWRDGWRRPQSFSERTPPPPVGWQRW